MGATPPPHYPWTISRIFTDAVVNPRHVVISEITGTESRETFRVRLYFDTEIGDTESRIGDMHATDEFHELYRQNAKKARAALTQALGFGH